MCCGGRGSSVGARGGFGIKMRLFEFQHLDLEGVNSHCPLPELEVTGGAVVAESSNFESIAVAQRGERARGNKYAQFRHLDISFTH